MAFLSIVLLGSLGCNGSASDVSLDTSAGDTGDLNPAVPRFVGELTTEHTTATTNHQGLAAVSVVVPEGGSSFLLTARTTDHLAVTYQILDPTGAVVLHQQDWWGDEHLTGAFAGVKTSTVSFPIRVEDGPLDAGEYQVYFAVVDSDVTPIPNHTLDLTKQIKTDSDLTTGTVHVDIVISEEVANAGHTEAIEAAVEYWNAIWNELGLAAEVTIQTADIPGELYVPEGFYGSTGQSGSDYFQLSSESGDERFTMVISETINNGGTLLGFAGSSPGPMVPSEKSVTVLAASELAGVDGVFDQDEIEKMGATMAHELGHYVGLAHPVEFDTNRIDAYSDTPVCDGLDECLPLLGDNIMFPSQVCYDGGTCVKTTTLTPQQLHSANLYAGVL